MRKTICYCDFCKKETPDDNLAVFGDNYEICKSCRYEIVAKVIREKTFNLTPWCKICKATGKIKESVGCGYDHNVYETKKCDACTIKEQ